ncbi:MAG: haloacid dehalogenase type II [Thermomicrobiales bacterium]|nr:haloacid dehalogenase type II [Thermomicrobiales bacterium]
MTEIRTATFDCYGTLIDWEGGLATFLYDLALQHGDPGDNGDALRRQWEAIQFDLIQGQYRSYKDILVESLRRWMNERGYPWSPERGEELVRSMRSWQPFSDTIPALAQVRQQGWKLAILSNTDRDIIAHSLRHLRIPFDAVVTAEDCGSYKPSPNNFRQLLGALELPPREILHVAFGFKYDIGPAAELGMASAWINRHVEPTPPGAAPDHEWRDLWGLATFAGGSGPGF